MATRLPSTGIDEALFVSAEPQSHEQHLQHPHQDDLLGSSLKAAPGNGVDDVPQRKA